MGLLEANTERWKNVKINNNHLQSFNVVASRLNNPSAVARYKAVEAKTGVPWWFIAVVHEREASQSWAANIAQGDRWDRRSVHVPAGRGPFQSWEEAAVDALVNCAPYAARNHDWSPGSALTWLEKYNGLGYANKGIPSPYIWAGTNQYTSGKYVADGVFSSTAVDTQLGCAGLLIAMKAFSQPKVTPTGPKVTAPAVIVATSAAATTAAPHMWMWIMGGGLLAAAMAWMIFHFTERK